LFHKVPDWLFIVGMNVLLDGAAWISLGNWHIWDNWLERLSLCVYAGVIFNLVVVIVAVVRMNRAFDRMFRE
jgi:hypothetical protein